MIIHDHIQGSDAWHKARAGIPTASAFAKVITAVKMELSAQADGYENRLVAERITGHPIDDFGGTKWIERGKELEGDAVQFYEMLTGLDCTACGFMTNDAKTFGGSPDALVGAIGGLELKCPAPQTHVEYLLNPKGAYEAYKPQVQGNLMISGRQWWDVMSYHPELPPALYRATPDLAYQAKLKAALDQMEKNIQIKIAKIQAMR